MQRKLLFMEDLYDFFSKNSLHTFNAQSDNHGQPIYVQTHGLVSFSNDDASEGLLFVNLKMCHDGENLNHSYIATEDMEAALPSILDRPILGYLHKVDGQWEFYGHNMEIDDDGNIEYSEVSIGHFPQDCAPVLKYDSTNEKNYVYAKGIIYEDYTHASEVLKREKECAVSVELGIRDLEYSSDDGLLHIKDFFFSGCTILGKDDNGNIVRPGMQGAKVSLSLSDFNRENNSIFSNQQINHQLIQTLDKLTDTLSRFDINTLQRKEELKKMDKFIQQMLDKYSITLEDVTFSTEGLSEEEISNLFEEHFGTTNTPTNDPETVPNFELASQFLDGLMESLSSEKITTEYGTYSKYCYVDHDAEASEVYVYSREDWKLYGMQYILNGDKVEVDFGSLRRKKFAIVDFNEGESDDTSLYSLVNPVIEAAISKTESNAKETYEIQLSELKSQYSDYEELKDFKSNTLKEIDFQKKSQILQDDAYFSIRKSEEFKNLAENIDSYSADEFAQKADTLLLKYAKEQEIATARTFSQKGTPNVKLQGRAEQKKDNPYGTLFDDYELAKK